MSSESRHLPFLLSGVETLGFTGEILFSYFGKIAIDGAAKFLSSFGKIATDEGGGCVTECEELASFSVLESTCCAVKQII